MGTTNRSVNKQEGKVPESITKQTEKKNVKRMLLLSAVLSIFGMNFYQPGTGSKKYYNLKTSNNKYKSNKNRQENKARAVQAKKNKTW